VDGETRRKLVWGWLRLLLGWLQMSLVAASVGALLTVGLHPITYVFVALATAAALTSRLLYHGRIDPSLKETPTDDKAQ
jgi:hypothetical protein